jgi:hypothetical protein
MSDDPALELAPAELVRPAAAPASGVRCRLWVSRRRVIYPVQQTFSNDLHRFT